MTKPAASYIWALVIGSMIEGKAEWLVAFKVKFHHAFHRVS